MADHATLLSRLRVRLAAFHREERGTLSVETMFMFPALLFVMLCMLVYIKIFEHSAILVKASEGVADIVSRETVPLDQKYLDNLNSLFKYLAQPPGKLSMRLSLVQYDADLDEYTLLWSHVPTGETYFTPANQSRIDSLESKIPEMADTDTVLLVETYMPWTAPYIGTMFNTGLTTLKYYNFIPIRPRFTTSPICWVTCS